VVVTVMGKMRVQPVARFARFPVANVVGKNNVVTADVERLAGAEQRAGEVRVQKLMAGATGAVQVEWGGAISGAALRSRRIRLGHVRLCTLPRRLRLRPRATCFSPLPQSRYPAGARRSEFRTLGPAILPQVAGATRALPPSDAVAGDVESGLQTILDAQFVVGAVEVGLHRGFGDGEQVGDLLVALPLGQRLEHALFARGEAILGGFGPAGQRPGQLALGPHLAAGDGADGLDQQRQRALPVEKAAGAGAQGAGGGGGAVLAQHEQAQVVIAARPEGDALPSGAAVGG